MTAQAAAPSGANKETKEWRIAAHDSFDRLWRPVQHMKRRQAYQLLAKRLGIEKVHIGESDIETCKKIIAIAEEEIARIVPRDAP